MMASDGSVMLSLVASFQRVAALTEDYNLIVEVNFLRPVLIHCFPPHVHYEISYEPSLRNFCSY